MPPRAPLVAALLFAATMPALAADAPPRELPDAAAVAARHLDRHERALVDAVAAHNGEALSLLERVVNINSGTHNFAGVREVGRIFGDRLQALGFTSRWADGAAFGRAGHLIADRPGHGPHVVLIGHLDTVFEQDSPFQRLQMLPGNLAKGPGVIDMKGGDVVALAALAALARVGALDRLHVTVYFGGDEEDSGEPLALARQDLVNAARGADVALGFEDGDGIADHAVVVRRGSEEWELRTTGTPAHSSQIFQPEIGAGAIYEAARILDGFYQALAREPNLTFSPGLIAGGTAIELQADQAHATVAGKSNVVAGTALVHGDLRCISPEQVTMAQGRMQQVVAQHLPSTAATLTFSAGYPPMASKPGNLALLAMLDRASRDLGLAPVAAVDPRRAGAADVSFVAAEVPRVLDALGMKGTGGHTVEETGDLSVLPTQTQKAALLLYRLSHGLPPAR